MDSDTHDDDRETWCARCGEKVDEYEWKERTRAAVRETVGTCPNCGNSSFKFSPTKPSWSWRILEKLGLVQ